MTEQDSKARGGKHVLSVLVENKPGTLTRISGLFARRGFNIDTLSVGPTEDENISRITLTVDGALHPIDQVTKQLNKLVNVIKIRDLGPSESITRELALFKIRAAGSKRQEVIEISNLFRGRIIDINNQSLTVEISGSEKKISAFEEMIAPLGLTEMMRSGAIAIARGGEQT